MATSTKIRKTKKQLERELADIDAQLKQAEQEEKILVESVKGQIDELCESNNLACGMKFTPADVLQLTNAMFNKEGIKEIYVKYNIYLIGEDNGAI